MAYREVSRVEIAEVVRRWQSGHGGHAYRYCVRAVLARSGDARDRHPCEHVQA